MQMSGMTKGVWFTYEDIHQIDRMLPSLMTERQAAWRSTAGCAGTQTPVECPSRSGQLAGDAV